MLVGIFVLVERGSFTQLFVGTTFCAVYMLLQVTARPYAGTLDNYLANCCSFLLLTFFLSCTTIKMCTLTELQNVQDVMSTEQERDFYVPLATLSTILVVCIFGALVASFVMLLLQLSIEKVQAAREARAAKARRLRYLKDGCEVNVAPVEGFHLFLSHVWGSGQDQMRIVKQRLCEMLPDINVFLDVDDLEEIGNLESYIERTTNVLVYCSTGYFESRNCLCELIAAKQKHKPCIALVDPDRSRGGLSLEEVRSQLLGAESSFVQWGFAAAVVPLGQALYDHLFAHEEIEWNRIGHFQVVTMRLLAERLLPESARGQVYVDKEIRRTRSRLAPPQGDHSFHVFCSDSNAGAAALLTELAAMHHFTLQMDPQGGFSLQRDAPRSTDISTEMSTQRRSTEMSTSARMWWRRTVHNVLRATADIHDLGQCDHFLLYLTSQTWTRGDASSILAEEVRRAMDQCVHVLLAHEMSGISGQEARHGCDFSAFFSSRDGATPVDLLQRGLYSEVAVALKGGHWREASMVKLGLALDTSKAEEAGDLGLDEASLDGEMISRARHIGQSWVKAGASLQTMVRRVRLPKERRGSTEGVEGVDVAIELAPS